MPIDATTTMRTRILDAAGEALARVPLSKLTMEDIARGAGIARQTVYKHFSSRDEIVVALFIAQIDDVHQPVLMGLHAKRVDADQLTTMFLEQLRMANEWVLLDRTFDPAIAPRVAELVLASRELADCNARLWAPILDDYQRAGVVRPDVDLDRAIRWMTYQSVWFLSHPEALTGDPDERRSYVRSFLVGALI